MLGETGMKKLAKSRVAVFGIGGVGYTVEALRSGVGTLDLIDNDTVCVSNLNRQIIATYETVGMDESMRQRAYPSDSTGCGSVNA